jgi:hypothetical protein
MRSSRPRRLRFVWRDCLAMRHSFGNPTIRLRRTRGFAPPDRSGFAVSRMSNNHQNQRCYKPT